MKQNQMRFSYEFWKYKEVKYNEEKLRRYNLQILILRLKQLPLYENSPQNSDSGSLVSVDNLSTYSQAAVMRYL